MCVIMRQPLVGQVDAMLAVGGRRRRKALAKRAIRSEKGGEDVDEGADEGEDEDMDGNEVR